ncbi:MAG: hypothetical protein U0324_00050 [Polyangiales bacterium]
MAKQADGGEGDGDGAVRPGSVWVRTRDAGARPPAADGEGFFVVTEVVEGVHRTRTYCHAKWLNGRGFDYQAVADFVDACDPIGEVGDTAGMTHPEWIGARGFQVRAAALALALAWLDGDAGRR